MKGDRTLLLRGALGGALMGFANLVPGISGGTMLLATGVYPRFVSAVAELTTGRFRRPSLALLASISVPAGGIILLFAGPIKELVIEQRWLAYSLFIGLTLGGVPIVWRLAERLTPPLLMGTLGGFGAMLAMALVSPPCSSNAGNSAFGLFAAGIAGAAAMVLPGVSGGYLLLVLGQYIPILAGVDALKRGLLPLLSGDSPDLALVGGALQVAIPVGIGVLVGIAAVSNLVRWTLERFRNAALGVLLGLLFGALVGLWPFQRSLSPAEARSPAIGAPLESATPGEPADGPLVRFSPDSGQVAASLLLVALGLSTTWAIGRLGEVEKP